MELKQRRLWLHSAPTDLAVLLVPLLVIGALLGYEVSRGPGRHLEGNYAGWVSQFLLLNTSHVLLTLLLLAKRKDVLTAALGQRSLVVGGGTIAFVVSFALFWLTQVAYPAWEGFAVAIGYMFATQHRLSQTKGVWSLYNMVGQRFGLERPTPRELKLQRMIVPVGLMLVSVRVLFVPNHSWSQGAPVVAVPGMAAPLPYATVYVLTGAWLVLIAVIATTFRGSFRTSGKPVYVILYGLFYSLLIYSPVWGSALIGGVHGLEYLLLTDRMLKDDDPARARSGRLFRWVTLFVAMSPALAIGLLIAPFSLALAGAAAVALVYGQLALNSVVMAHYFIDAVIYRFRIPTVRATMLRRLQLAS